jgi:hypothetical protein
LSIAAPTASAAPAPVSEPKPAVEEQKSAESPAERTAVTEAQRTGQQVEVTEKLTETSTTLANPDGTFTLRTHAQPVRVRKDGAWRGVDTTLIRTADGGLTPTAVPVGMTFSGGGTAPLVTLTEGGKTFALSWPTPLPVPVLNGASATYPGVLAGVDLQVTASSIGYSEVLIVKDAAAAANPALKNIKLAATTDSLSLQATADGTLSAKDSAGSVVFHGSTPIMWDSSHDQRTGSAPTATDPGGGKVSAMKLTTGSGATSGTAAASAASNTELTVTPDPKALTGPGVQYPVYLDPVMSRYQAAWTEVTNTGWHYWNANMQAQVGPCYGWNECGSGFTARSYFRFTTTDLQARNGYTAHVFDAKLYATQRHGVWCNPEEVAVHQAGDIDENSRWPGPDSFEVNRQSSAAGDDCGGARPIEFDVLRSANEVVQSNAANLTLGLIAPNEQDNYQWKKFDNNPHLDVSFAFPPNKPTGLRVSNAINCGGGIITPDAYPTFYSTATDNNDPPLNITMWHEVWNNGTGHTSPNPPTIASGTIAAWTSDVDLGDNNYALRVASKNQFPGHPDWDLWHGPWSDWLSFTTRSKPVTQQPSITSSEYPQDYWGRQQDMPGTFTFKANGAPNLAGFSYSFTGSGTEAVPKSTDCNYNQTFGTNGGWIASTSGTATITVPNTLSPGYHTLHVRSFDDAHKFSPESQAYTFYVAPTLTPAAPTAKFEAEGLAVTGTGVTTSVVNHANTSGGKYLAASTTVDGSAFGARFTVPAEGDYDVTAGMVDDVNSPDQVAYTLDGKPVSDTFPGGTSTAVAQVEKVLAGIHLTAGTHELGLKITKKAGSSATTFKAGLDFVRLSPTNQLDAEALPLIESTRFIAKQPNCCGPVWRAGAQLRFEGDSVDQYFVLRLNAPVEADYAVGAGMTKAFHYGKYTVTIDDKPLARSDVNPVDAYGPGAVSTYQPLGGIHLTVGEHRIKFKAVGTNPASTDLKYRLGLDYLTLQPINNVMAASFADAMNNKGIGTDGSVSASLDTTSGSLSSQTLAAAGFAPGATATINGAAFTMPARNATTGNDNVIAMGQTIPFPAGQQVKANAVGLLVTSTCGQAQPIAGTVTYTDGSTSNPVFPSLRDWTWLPEDKSGITLPYRNVGTTPERIYQPVLYPIFVPADPTKTLQSITLPNYGTSFLTGTCAPAPAVHVLAMAPRPVAAGWVSAWSASADAAVVPPDGTGFANKTLRTVVHPTITGGSVRIRLSNDDVALPVTIGAASIAAQSGSESATLATPVALKFSGTGSVTIPAGGEMLSDPIAAPAGGSGNFVVSLYLPNAVAQAPVHEGATAPSYLSTGNNTSNTTGAPFTTTLTGSYYLSRLDVSTTDATNGTIAVLGDQFSAAGPAGSGQRNTWVDNLPAKLGTAGVPLPGSFTNTSRNGIPDAGRWKLNDGTGTTARDTAAQNHATASGGVTWGTEHNGSANLNGTNGLLATAGPVLDTSRDYSVSVWVKLKSTQNNSTVVSQGGTDNASFYLQYSRPDNAWVFLSPSSNSASPTGFAVARAGTPPTVDKWTHLAGTFEASTGAMRLYVDSQLGGSAVNSTPWTGTGPLAIGGVKRTAGATYDFLNGSVSDVRVHRRTLSSRDVELTYKEHFQGAYGPYPSIGGVTASNIERDLGRSVLSTANVRTVLVAVGANDLLAGASASTVKGDLTKMMRSDNVHGLKQTKRNDGTSVHLIITTVPPLGLSTSDPREAQRRQLNQDIIAKYLDFGADDVVDFDAAVRNAGDVSKIDPNYLTNGLPNDRYHDKIAQTMAEACADFPPRAEL